MPKLALVLSSSNWKTLPDGALDDRVEIVRLVVLPSSASINAASCEPTIEWTARCPLALLR